MTIAIGNHLLPFRTEKLSLSAPMVLRLWKSRSLPTFKIPVLFEPGFFSPWPRVCNRSDSNHGVKISGVEALVSNTV